MTDTPAPAPHEAPQPEPEQPDPARPAPALLDELLWPARDAQERLPLDTLGDSGYVLGQRRT